MAVKKKRRRSPEDLGRQLARFGGKSLKPVLAISAALTVIGAGLLLCGALSQPTGVLWVLVGIFLAAAGPMYLVTNWSGSRNTLEVHKGGLRFTSGRETKELPWDDIEEISAGKVMNLTYHRTEWNVVIQPQRGRAIELEDDFWRSQGGGAGTFLGLVKGYVPISVNKAVGRE